MRILVICPHYEPDLAPTGVVITEIVAGLAQRGHKVDVVTSVPWYAQNCVERTWRGRLVWREQTAWGSVMRVYPFPAKKGRLWARALGYGGFTVLAAVCSLFRTNRPDVVMAMSPPLTLGLAAYIAARLRGAPFVFNVQDIFPEVAIKVGLISNRSVVRALECLERFVYRRAAAVTVLSRDARQNIKVKLGDWHSTQVVVIPNFVDTDAIQMQSRNNAYRAEFGLGERIVVMYAGNIGYSQPLELMIGAARAFCDRADVVFVINGDGTKRQELQQLATGFQNVLFVDYQPAERLAEVLAAADVQVIILRRGLAQASLPSKLYAILSAGRAILASVDDGSEIAEVVTSSGAGLVVSPDHQASFTAALAQLVDNCDREEMGQRGRQFVLDLATPESVARAYETLFVKLIDQKETMN